MGKLPACSIFKETPVSHIAENWEVPWAYGRGAGRGGGVPVMDMGIEAKEGETF